jgi:multidrug resistance efflux pump
MPRIRINPIDVARMAITLVVVAIAVYGGYLLWYHFQRAPWTRDGRVRADVVQIAPDVGGLVTELDVDDNQPVRRGQVLFVIDRQRYAYALRQAEASIATQRANLLEAQRELRRNQSLGELVAREQLEQSQSRTDQAAAALAQALAARDVAALNLERTTVRAPTDGYLSEVALRVGDYVGAGQRVIALIDASSFRVEGYFEETKLPNLHVGQAVTVKIMGEPNALRGHIESIARGIADRDRTATPNLLPSITPTFSWVRLAQRVPVRIVLDDKPTDMRLIAGRTVTVEAVGAGVRP